MRTEKITINLSLAELGPIDYLVAKGVYASRSDFIRLAIRKQTDTHAKDIEQFLEPPHLADDAKSDISRSTIVGVGIIALRQSDVDHLLQTGHKLKIRVLGAFIVSDTVTAEQIEELVTSAEIYGKVFANDGVKAALKNKGKLTV